MKTNGFIKLKLIELGEDEYIIEVETTDGGKGVIDLDFTDYGEVAYLDIQKEKQSELVDAFYDEINTMYGIIDYVKSLGADYEIRH